MKTVSRSLGTFLMLVSAGSAVSAFAQTQPAPSPAASPITPVAKRVANENTSPVTGTIKGRVVSDDGRPITNATLVAQAITGPPAGKPGRTDSQGRFTFNDLPQAAYIVLAVAPGYIDESLSSGDRSQWPHYLIGSQLKITMIKGGVITGTVTNSKGEPVVGVPVRATVLNGGPSAFSAVMGNAGESDDRGVYRIYGLPPGQYVVNAGGSGQFGMFVPSGFDLDVPTYYPSASLETAVPVAARSGEETTGIDIKYQGTQGHRISGIVLGTVDAGAANSAIMIALAHAGTQSMVSLAIAGPMDQRGFNFNGVADGDYDLFAALQSSKPDTAPSIGTKRVTVRGADLTGIELTLAQLGSIAGTITLDPIKPEDKCDERGSQLIETVFTAPRDDPKKSGSQLMTGLISGFGGTMNAKGEFAARNLDAGRYRFDIKLPTDSWYVRAINLPAAVARTDAQPGPPTSQPSTVPKPNTSNTWQGVITIKSGQQVGGVSISVGQDAAGLRGRVAVTPDGTAVPAGLRVHLVPADPEQANNILRYSETLVASDGTFALLNIAPGRYFILTRLEPVVDTQATSPRPSAWDPTARAKLRQEAEAAQEVVGLKPCQRLKDYALPLKTPQ